jgi:hypothetical protein
MRSSRASTPGCGKNADSKTGSSRRDDAKGIIEDWREDYHQQRPHSSLKQQTPSEFVAHWKQTRTALEAEILTLETAQL